MTTMQYISSGQRGAFLGLVSLLRDEVQALETEGARGVVAPGYVGEKCERLIFLSQRLKEFAELLHASSGAGHD